MRDFAPQGSGRPLYEARQSLLLTRAKLAKKCGVSTRTIYNMEMGRGSQMDSKRRVLKGLGIPFERRREIFPELVEVKTDELA